ncbi:MAG: cadherin-like beta sandwich domain-containing protein [Flavobacterium sp.]
MKIVSIILTFLLGSFLANAQGNALHFDGSNDHVVIPFSNSHQMVNTLTIEAWINPEQGGNIVTKQSYGYGLGLESDGRLFFWDQSSQAATIKTPINSVRMNRWQHVAVTVQDVGSTLTINFYVDGILYGPYTSTQAQINNGGTNTTLDLGIQARGVCTCNYFRGRMDEFRLWNTVRSQAEIQNNRLNTISSASTGLVAYYHFNQGTTGGTNTGISALTDQTTNSNNGTLTNFALAAATSNWIESYAMVVPTLLPVTAASGTSFTANWSVPAVGTVTNYRLDVSTSADFSSFVSGYNGLTVNGTSQIVSGLTSGVTYFYRVRADKTSVTGQGGYTNTATYSNHLTALGINNKLATSAYSLRKLNPNYSGNAIQVRRSDNVTQDIGFASNGDLNTSALLTFVGSQSAFVTIWYDQSGNGRNLTQSNTIRQPLIVNAGSILSRNGKPTVYFDASNDGMVFSGGNYLATNPITVNLVAGSNANTNTFRRAVQGSANWLIGPYNNQHSWYSGNWNHQTNAPWSTTNLEYITVIQPSFTANTSFRNGVSQSTANNKGLPLVLNLGTEGGYAEIFDGYISEVISFNQELTTTERQSMELSQVNYYKSSDANLAALTTTAGTLTPAFAAATTVYTTTVANTTTSVTVTATRAEANATMQVQVNGGSFATLTNTTASSALALNVGDNTIDVRVTAEDGTTQKTYTITVTRAAPSNNADLSALVISSGTLSPLFNSATIGYSANVTNATTSITVTATRAQANANLAVRVNGGGYIGIASGTASSALALNVGSNTIDVQVTAQNGTTQKIYTITVTRALSNNADLSNLTTTAGVITFASIQTSYAINVNNFITGATVTATRAQANATLEFRVNGGTYTLLSNGSASSAFSLNVGSNTINVRVTAQDGTTQKIYTITVTRAASSNADLSALSTSVGVISPTFTSGNLNYTASVTNTTTNITVTATRAHPNATLEIRINGGTYTSITSAIASDALALNVGNNTINVRVTAQDGTTLKTYTINVNRATSNNANLSALTISAGVISPTFAAATTAYTASVTNATTSVTVTATRAEANATLEARVNGGTFATITNATASSALALSVGSNTIDVRVTAQNGTTQKTYTITVTRAASNNADLSYLTTSVGAMSPTFAATTTAYTESVDNTTTSVTVQATRAQVNATLAVQVNGGGYTLLTSPVPNGSLFLSSALALNVGSNTIDVRVTAQDGTTQKTYTITVTRTASNNADLSALTTTAGTISPTFAAATTAYTASVTNATTSVTVTATRAEANATMEARVNGGAYATITNATASSALALNVGSNTIDVRVTAQDGTTQKIYTITVTRAASNNADLFAISFSAGALSPAFTAATTDYFVSVPNSTTSAIVLANLSGVGATMEVRVNGGTYSSLGNGVISNSLSFNVGINSINIRVTAQDGTTQKTYTIGVFRTSSNNANLSDLTTSAGAISPTFSATTYAYTASVDNATTSVTVTATRAEANAILEARINGGTYTTITSATASSALALNVGSNSIDVLVTAQDGLTQNSYTINVTRAASNNADLSALTTTAGTISPTFAAATTAYTANVANATTSVTVTATLAQANATLEARVNGGTYATITNATASSALALNVGTNTINVRVTAQDGTTQKTYTITVTRAASSNADLSALTTTAGAISPTFAAATTAYTASVTNATTSVNITATRAEANATLEARINGGAYTTITNATASSALALNVGTNTINVRVTAQDGTTQKTYIITVTRAVDTPGNALHFDGVNDFVNCGVNAALNITSSMTVELWIRPTQNLGNGKWDRLIHRNWPTGYFFGGKAGATNALAVVLSGDLNAAVTPNNTITVGIWQHVSFVFDDLANRITIYKDGNIVTTTTWNGTITGGAHNLTISDSGECFGGNIDEVRIWNVARTQAQIQSNLYNKMNGATPNLVAYYNFDHGVVNGTNTGVTTLVDQSTTARNGTLTNFTLSGTTSNWVESYAMVVARATDATNANNNSFVANWNAPTLGIASDYILDVSTNQNFSSFVPGYNGLSVTGTSQLVTGLTQGTTYFYRVRANKSSVNGQGAISNNQRVFAGIITWNGTSWNNVTGPTAFTNTLINGNYLSANHGGSLTANNLTVASSGSLTMSSGHTLNLSGALINEASQDAVVIESGAYLIQNTDVANTGSVTIKRNANIKRLDISLWSSPVVAQNLLALSPLTLTNRFFTYNEAANNWAIVSNVANHTMAIGVGYGVRAPNDWSLTTETFTGTFKGVPNNGNYTQAFTSNHATANYNAIGNPYPSVLDLRDFYDANDTKIRNTFYFFEHTVAPGTQGQTNYGTLVIAPDPAENVYNPASNSPNAINQANIESSESVEVGQGFFVRALEGQSGVLNFDNTMRKNTTSGVFFRNNVVQNTETSKFRLEMHTPEGYLNQAFVGYYDYADDGLDIMDAQGIGAPLYTLLNGQKLVIQGFGLPFNQGQVISLGGNFAVAGTYSIGLHSAQGIFENEQFILLHDTELGIYHNLSLSPYSFEALGGANETRFEIVFTSILSNENPTLSDNSVVVYKLNDVLQAQAKGNSLLTAIEIVDLSGRKLYSQSELNTNVHIMEKFEKTETILLINTTTADGKTQTHKVFY